MDRYDAIADPTRRLIIDLLATGSRNAGSIAAEFPVSRPAISRHLRILRESGIVTVEEQAQQRIYHLRPEQLSDVAAWISRYTTFSRDRLAGLANHIRQEIEQ